MRRKKPELGKYLLWWHFAKNKSLRRYLPATARMTKQVFVQYLNKYGMVYAKPSGGSRGVGIMKVWSNGTQVFVKKTVLPTRTFSSREAAWSFVNQQRSRAHSLGVSKKATEQASAAGSWMQAQCQVWFTVRG